MPLIILTSYKGWTSNPSIHWFPSLIGLVLVGMSFLLIFQVGILVLHCAPMMLTRANQSGINYLIDAYTRVSASAVGTSGSESSYSTPLTHQTIHSGQHILPIPAWCGVPTHRSAAVPQPWCELGVHPSRLYRNPVSNTLREIQPLTVECLVWALLLSSFSTTELGIS